MRIHLDDSNMDDVFLVGALVVSESVFRFPLLVSPEDLVTNQLPDDLARLLPAGYEVTSDLVAKWPAQIPSYDLIKWMEISAATVATRFHAPELISRGTELNFKPYSEACLGDRLTIKVVVTKHNRKFIYFDIEVLKAEALVAKMSHKRFIQKQIEVDC